MKRLSALATLSLLFFQSFASTVPVYPVVILGGGIGALTSAIYLGRAELSPLVIEGEIPGGLLTKSHSVQNWPGELEIEGSELTDRMREQAEASGAFFTQEEVVGVDFKSRPYKIQVRSLDGKNEKRELLTESCIIAMGTTPNYLHVPGETGEKGYWGRGVTNCAICDGNLYRDKKVAVIGGGDAAVLEALYLSNIAKDVYVFVRKGSLKATEESRVSALLEKPNVHLMYHTEVKQIQGDDKKLKSVKLKTKGKEMFDFPVDGLFLAIGSTPNSAIFRDSLKLDENGYIVLKESQKTSVEGVYAVGDIADPHFKQAVSASGDGAKAALLAQQFVSDRANGLAKRNQKKQKNENAAEVVEIYSLEQFDEALEKSSGYVLVDFYASWCGPCKKIAPLLHSFAEKSKGKVKVLKVNVDKLHALSDMYEIRSMPTAILFDASGEVVERKIGYGPIASLLENLEEKGSRL